MSNKLFGTDGVRGKANVYPMVPEFALKLGQAAGKLIATKHKRVVIGKDTRISGDMLESALIAGFTSVGVDVILLGVLPTPAISLITSRLNVDMAVVISASHNPYFDNGLKLKDGAGDKLSSDVTAKLEGKILNSTIELDFEKIGKIDFYEDAVDDYMDSFLDDFDLKGLKVVIDCANGAFSNIAPEILENLGADIVIIGNTPDGYNINKDCGSTNTDLLCKTVVESKADLGIALDGDGDRIVVADDKGNKVNCDQLIAFLGKYLQSKNTLKGNAIVTTELSNMGIAKYCKSLGLSHHSTSVGEHHVIEKMREIDANVGGEESGHIVLTDFSKSGDGLVVGINLCQALLDMKKKMSNIFPVFEPFPMTITNIRFDTKEKAAQAVDSAEAKKVIEEARKTLSTGSVIVRKSGTEPIIRLYIQGEDKVLLDEVTAKLKQVVEKGR